MFKLNGRVLTRVDQTDLTRPQSSLIIRKGSRTARETITVSDAKRTMGWLLSLTALLSFKLGNS